MLTGFLRVTIASYTHNCTLTSKGSVPLGTQIILACRVVGLPYGTPLSYTWTCPNGPCEVEGYYGRKVYNEHILAVNTTSTSDGGTYTCQVTAKGGQETTGSFTMSVTGMCSVYTTAVSYELVRPVISCTYLNDCIYHFVQVAVLSTAMGDSFLMSSP